MKIQNLKKLGCIVLEKENDDLSYWCIKHTWECFTYKTAAGIVMKETEPRGGDRPSHVN